MADWIDALKVACSRKQFFDTRAFRRNPAFDNADGCRTDSVGYVGGWLMHPPNPRP